MNCYSLSIHRSTEARDKLSDCKVADVSAVIAIREGFDESVQVALRKTHFHEGRLSNTVYRVSKVIFDFEGTAFFLHITANNRYLYQTICLKRFGFIEPFL